MKGDLKRLLRSGSVPLTALQRLAICYEASVALARLSSEQIVHTDIAARNFLVSRTLSVKLSCVAAARGVDAGDYCELGGRLVPLRWLAPESALTGSYTSASDVWSYAIFVTEVSELGFLMSFRLFYGARSFWLNSFIHSFIHSFIFSWHNNHIRAEHDKITK